MLDETNSDRRRGSSPTAASVRAASPPSVGDQPQRAVTGPSAERHDSSVLWCLPCEDIGSNPRVSLAHLRAILEQGGGMSATDVSEVFESVSTAERRTQQEEPERQQQQQPTLASGAEIIAGVEEGLAVGAEGGACLGDSAEGAEKRKPLVAEDKEGQGAAAEVNTRTVVETAKTKELPKIGGQGSTETDGEREDQDVATVRKIDGDGEGEDGTAVEKPSDGEPLTISFTTVCDCEVVRAWVRKGAFTLPSFDVTSGRREDGAFADRVVIP